MITTNTELVFRCVAVRAVLHHLMGCYRLHHLPSMKQFRFRRRSGLVPDLLELESNHSREHCQAGLCEMMARRIVSMPRLASEAWTSLVAVGGAAVGARRVTIRSSIGLAAGGGIKRWEAVGSRSLASCANSGKWEFAKNQGNYAQLSPLSCGCFPPSMIHSVIFQTHPATSTSSQRTRAIKGGWRVERRRMLQCAAGMSHNATPRGIPGRKGSSETHVGHVAMVTACHRWSEHAHARHHMWQAISVVLMGMRLGM